MNSSNLKCQPAVFPLKLMFSLKKIQQLIFTNGLGTGGTLQVIPTFTLGKMEERL